MAKKETVLSVLRDIRDYLKGRIPQEFILKPDLSQRFIKDIDGIVIDTLTSLMWGPTFEKEMNWNDAQKACKDLCRGNHKDWRLPTVEELRGIIDYTKYNPAIDTKFFPDTKSGWYLTSTISAGSPDYAWIVLFTNGLVDTDYKNYNNYVRPVRSSK